MSLAAKKVVPPHTKDSIYKIIDECSLSIDEEYEYKEFIEGLGIEYLCTPFSSKAAHILGKMNVNAFKIGSGECNNQAVLKAAAEYKKPMIISTGMNTLDSCKKTYNFVRDLIGENIILLHTTNLYPTPFHLVRLGGVEELKEISGEFVGLSDHTTSNLASLGAVAIGAVILERHFTDTKEREGPDIVNSMTPNELKELKESSEIMFKMRGGSKVKEIPEEDAIRDFAFATIVATRNLKAGEIITKDNTWPKRPGIGQILAREHEQIIGRKIKKNVKKDNHISYPDFL
jgi:Sialic acid synthase